MPVVLKIGVVIDPNRRAEGQSAICAAHKHHIGRSSARRLHACQHIDVVMTLTARMIDRQEQLTVEAGGIYRAAGEEAAHINRGNLIKNRRLIPDLRVARANAIKHVVKVAFAANKEISIRVDVQRSELS
jgi:hypothetical protein